MVKCNELKNKNIKDEFWEWSADGAFKYDKDGRAVVSIEIIIIKIIIFFYGENLNKIPRSAEAQTLRR